MSTTIPPTKILNVLEAAKDASGSFSLDISHSLGLEHIVSAIYSQIPSGGLLETQVQEGKNLACFILTGSGELKKGTQTAPLTPSDCFSFAASNATQSFTLVAGQSPMTALIVSDILPAKYIATTNPPEFPKIISAEKTAEWRSKGIDVTKAARLVKATDMGVQEDPPWGLTLERIPPGTQSSNPHAHLYEDEFALIVGGKARYWHQGETPDRILVPGDAVGWKAGTGICHNLINDATDEHGAGEDLIFLVWGLDSVLDKVHYATANPPWWTNESRWWECPIHPIGSAHPLPHHPRPAERPYSS